MDLDCPCVVQGISAVMPYLVNSVHLPNSFVNSSAHNDA